MTYLTNKCNILKIMILVWRMFTFKPILRPILKELPSQMHFILEKKGRVPNVENINAKKWG